MALYGAVGPLCLLQERIAALQKAGRSRDTLAQAKALLAGAATRVLESLKPAGAGNEDYYSINWNDPKDRDSMDEVRLEVLRMLSALK